MPAELRLLQFVEELRRRLVEPEPLVDLPHAADQAGADFGRLRKRGANSRQARIEHLPCRDALSARMERVRVLEQRQQEARRLAGDVGLALRHPMLRPRVLFGAIGHQRETRRDAHANDRRHRQPDQLPLAATLLAPLQAIEADAEQSRGDAQQGVALAVLAQVHAERFGPRFRETPVGIERKAQRAGKAFPIGFAAFAREGFAVDDQAEDPVGAAEPLEGEDFLVDPIGFRGGRRSDHDQGRGFGQRLGDGTRETGGTGEVGFVAEDRRQAFARGLRAQFVRHAKSLERAVEPPGERRILVAVADEGRVPQAGERARRRRCRSRCWRPSSSTGSPSLLRQSN